MTNVNLIGILVNRDKNYLSFEVSGVAKILSYLYTLSISERGYARQNDRQVKCGKWKPCFSRRDSAVY